MATEPSRPDVAAVVQLLHETNPETLPLQGQRLLHELVVFLRRFVVMSNAQADAVALWIVHTHAFGAADTTPYLSVTSAEKRSGKTRLLEVLELLVRAPLPTANISDAALFRAIAKLKPTLLFDEVDAIFGPKARDREDLRGMLNAGYRHGAVARRIGGAKNDELQAFPVFCPKAFAGIGELPDTIRDRTIRIRLERRIREETVERFRRREVSPEAIRLRDRVAGWAEAHVDELTVGRPQLPDELDDREQDCWEALLAIADLAGGDWPAIARAAALALSTGDSREDDSLGARLLADMHEVFEASGEESYRTADMIAELAEIEEAPWGDWYGKGISPQALGKLLKPYRIKTMAIWSEGEKHRGYKRETFEDAWLRVLGGRTGRGGSSGSSIEAAPTTPTAPTAIGAVAVCWECPCGHEPPTKGSTLTAVRTLVSLREPKCPSCGRPFRGEYRQHSGLAEGPAEAVAP
jgi:Protein of unknown function (DUF3631)